MEKLTELRVAVLATDGFEEQELTEPVRALREAGAHVEIISPKKGKIQGFRHFDKTLSLESSQSFDGAEPNLYDSLVLPGGALNADALRADPKALSFIKSFFDSGKPVAAICHAPWELISARVLKNRKLTSYFTIQDDIRNAGAEWVDSEVVVDGNLLTSRQPADLPAFNREMIKLFSQIPKTAAA